MILFLGMPRLSQLQLAVLSLPAHAMCHSAEQSRSTQSIGQSVSNAVGNECSESMRKMCGCVGFSVRANTQVYAQRSRWNLEELKETARHGHLIPCPIPFSHLLLSVIVSLSLFLSSPFMLSDCSLSFNPLQGRSFRTETKG